MICPNCGKEIKDGVNFCSKCGFRIAEAKASGAEEPHGQASADSSQYVAPQGPAGVPPMQPAGQATPQTSADSSQYAAPQGPAAAPPMPPTGYVAPQAYAGAPGPGPEKKKKTGLLIAGIAGGLVLVAAIVFAIIFFGGDKNGTVSSDNDTELSADGSDFSKDYTDRIDKAKKLYDDGKTEDAISELETAIDRSPKDYLAYEALFTLYLNEKDLKAARIVAENGLEAVESPSGKMRLETCLSRLEDPDAGTKTADAPAAADELEPSDGMRDGEGEPDYPELLEKSEVVMSIRQIDNSNYPEIAVYTDISDPLGNSVENIRKEDLVADEEDAKGQIHHVSIKDVVKIAGEENISINLVIDKSDSMRDYDSMQQVKNAVHTLIDQMDFESGDQMEIVSFDSYVYLDQEFCSDQSKLRKAVDGIYPSGMTSLYDAIYSALYQTYPVKGARCVVAFTDGLENSSSYTYEDVVNLARSTGIPVYIVGVGGEYDAAIYMQLASECNGTYYSAARSDIQDFLAQIYVDLYTQQQDYWVLRYDTANRKNTGKEWKFRLSMSDTSPYKGDCEKDFVAKADLAGAFSDRYYNVDYMLPHSGTQALTYNDLNGLSLAQLRIARNEIFARHGRQFKDALLNQWFYSKSWYLSIPLKYAPDFFDKNNPNPLSKVESDNVRLIKSYEESLMANQDIFPNANMIDLSTYDLALTKDVLKKALEQMKTYPDTETLRENIKKVKEVIETEGIKY